MITMPQTPITDHSFKKWGAIKVEESDDGIEYYYYLIPLPNDETDEIGMKPTLISTANDEWLNLDLEEGQYVISLFDFEELPNKSSN